MFDTSVTIVGNVLNQPETRRTLRTGALVTSFRVASTARRFDREKEVWVDGDSLRVTVSCWRKLGDHVAASVRQGDPVIVSGRIYTREYLTRDGDKRIGLEMAAATVGHDLARGTGRFHRSRPTQRDMFVERGGEYAERGSEVPGMSEESYLPMPEIDFSDVLGLKAEFSECTEGNEYAEPMERAGQREGAECVDATETVERSAENPKTLATSSIGA